MPSHARSLRSPSLVLLVRTQLRSPVPPSYNGQVQIRDRVPSQGRAPLRVVGEVQILDRVHDRVRPAVRAIQGGDRGDQVTTSQ